MTGEQDYYINLRPPLFELSCKFFSSYLVSFSLFSPWIHGCWSSASDFGFLNPTGAGTVVDLGYPRRCSVFGEDRYLLVVVWHSERLYTLRCQQRKDPDLNTKVRHSTETETSRLSGRTIVRIEQGVDVTILRRLDLQMSQVGSSYLFIIPNKLLPRLTFSLRGNYLRSTNQDRQWHYLLTSWFRRWTSTFRLVDL